VGKNESRIEGEVGELLMKKIFYLAVVLVFAANCSSESAVKKTSVNTSNNVNSSVANQTVSAANVETKSTEPNVADANNAPKLEDTMRVSREYIDREGRKKGGDPEPIKATNAFTNAADNSVISSTMNAQGVPIETRVFKDNQQLAKIEKSLENPKNPQIKVFLKNGKVVNLSSDKISNPSTASANEILIAVGALPKPAPQKNEAKTEIEKSEQ
jgi:hypothetical protein